VFGGWYRTWGLAEYRVAVDLNGVSGWSWLGEGAQRGHGEERLRRNETRSDRSAGYTRNGDAFFYTVIERPMELNCE